MLDWPLIVPALTAVVGVLIGYLLKRRGDLASWEREDRHRWHADKRAAYARFLAAAESFERRVTERLFAIQLHYITVEAKRHMPDVQVSELPGDQPSREALDLAHGEVELLGPITVTFFANWLISDLAELGRPLDPDTDRYAQKVDPLSEGYLVRKAAVRERRCEFVKAAREDLGVVDIPWRVQRGLRAYVSRVRRSLTRSGGNQFASQTGEQPRPDNSSEPAE